MEETAKKNNKSAYFLLDVGDGKILVLKVDFNVSFSEACEVIAIFGTERKSYAEKLVKDLNKSV